MTLTLDTSRAKSRRRPQIFDYDEIVNDTNIGVTDLRIDVLEPALPDAHLNLATEQVEVQGGHTVPAERNGLVMY